MAGISLIDSAARDEEQREQLRGLNVAGDQEAIARWLDRNGRLDDYRSVIGRGRPTVERAALREQLVEELAGELARLLIMGAYATAIAAVLGCHRHTIRHLAKAS